MHREREIILTGGKPVRDTDRSGARLVDAGKRGFAFLLKGVPTHWANVSYNAYSRFYQGQLRFGLPVPAKLLKSQEEIRSRSAAKLALSLYHIFFRITNTRIPRNEIKLVLLDELDKGRIRLTEDVIFLSEEELRRLASDRFHIPSQDQAGILAEARRRRILKETLKAHRAPAYFESEIEESGENGRGDYEIVHYMDYTDEGKAIGFRRLASMEAVTTRDNRPSLVMVPGIGCNSNCFNLNNRHSVAKNLADMGFWVYLFDPRGMGVNKNRFDPLLTIDTLIDSDLAAVVRFIFHRSKGKPVILVSHSMGGIVSEYMVLNWSLRRNFDKLDMFTDRQLEKLDKVLPPLAEAEAYLSMIRGVITLGAPKFFQKLSHPIFPYSLWLNHLSRILRLQNVPFREAIWFLTRLPGVRSGTKMVFNMNVAGLNPLISPKNHKNDRQFIIDYLRACGESFPLGLGFQFLKAIYNGEGFKRMDDTRLNYSELLRFLPDDIPLFRFWGTEDPLSPPVNMRFSQSYPHQVKRIYGVRDAQDLARVELSTERSQSVDFVVEGANHLDLLYGKVAERLIHPLLIRAIRQAWAGWSYPKDLEAP
jgi:pimeloyl-ACP methyl ester carboxylesterase